MTQRSLASQPASPPPTQHNQHNHDPSTALSSPPFLSPHDRDRGQAQRNQPGAIPHKPSFTLISSRWTLDIDTAGERAKAAGTQAWRVLKNSDTTICISPQPTRSLNTTIKNNPATHVRRTDRKKKKTTPPLRRNRAHTGRDDAGAVRRGGRTGVMGCGMFLGADRC